MTSTWHFRASIAAAALGAITTMLATPSLQAQSPVPRLITQAINPANLTTLAGNTRPEANAANDRGRVADSFQLKHMLLQLQRSDIQEQAFETLIDQLHDRNSPNFHKWLSVSEIGTRFGPAPADIQTITGWLQQNGFTVNLVYTNGMVIDFSGTAGQVRTAFHTEIHDLSVNGVPHIANMSDPEIPTALAPAVVGIVSLHDFRPQPQLTVPPGGSPINQFFLPPPGTTTTQYYVGPGDLATIYNFNPVFNSGNVGQGQTIYLIEASDVPVTNDWYTFRWVFGLPSHPTATLKSINPPPPSGSSTNCTDPGFTAGTVAPVEATLDTEYASAGAPGAAIVLVPCADVGTTSGLYIAVLNLIHAGYTPSIISMSYGTSETLLGQAANEMFNCVFQSAVAMGFSVFVSAGDAGPAESDRSGTNGQQVLGATHGINVNGHASTRHNVAVGGTDFEDTYLHANSTYWNSFNSTGQRSAKSYIPEIPWNDSCGSQLFAKFNSPPMMPLQFCNSSYIVTTNPAYLEPKGGSGGASACAKGIPSPKGVVNTTTNPPCQGWLRPSWQTGVVGLPTQSTDYGYNVRVLPDVSLFAAGALPWQHAYVFCYSGPAVVLPAPPPPPDTAPTQKNCNGSAAGWSYSGGTSFAAPIMAGVQALVNQHAGGPQGNPNYRYYQLAAQQYGPSGSSACNSSNGNAVGTSCIFYDITTGDNAVACTYYSTTAPVTSYDCYGLPATPPTPPTITYGVLVTPNTANVPAFNATTGWDFATGIGSVNVYNLVTNW
jgi:subtilase family serine protease